MSADSLSLRFNRSNPNNHGTWWLHYTTHLPDHTKKRVRKSLGTQDVEEARQLRDKILTAFAA